MRFGFCRMYGTCSTLPNVTHHPRGKTQRPKPTSQSFRYFTMGALKPTSLLILLYLTTATLAHPNSNLQSLHLTTLNKRSTTLFDLHKRCYGSCEECFGSGYQECSSSSSLCFKPNDPQHGEETCSSSGTINLPSVPTFDFCAQGDCESCFGAGFQHCPGSTSQCYKPGDTVSGLETCHSSGSESSSGSGTGTGTTTAPPTTNSDSTSTSSSGSNITDVDFCDNGGFDCKLCFGNSYIPCPASSQYAADSYCYDPNNATSICPDGTSPGGSAGSSDSSSSSSSADGSDSTTESSGSGSGSGSESHTASTPSTTTGSPNGVSSATSANNNGGTNGIGGGGTTSPTFTTSRGASAATGTGTGSSGASITSGASNGTPANATSDGLSSVGEGGGMFMIVAVLVVCFAAAAGFIL